MFTAVNLAGNLISYFLSLQYFSAFFDKKPDSRLKSAAVFLLHYTVAAAGSAFVLENSILVMPIQIIALFILSFAYKCRWFAGLLHALILYFVLGASELIVGMAYNALFGNFLDAREDVYVYALCSFSARLVSLLIIRFIRIIFKKHSIIDLKGMLFLVPLPAATIAVAWLFVRFFDVTSNSTLSWLAVGGCIALILANVSIFVLIDRMNDYSEIKLSQVLYEREYKAQKQHLHSLQEHLDETKVFRHDRKNELLSLLALMRAGENEKAIREVERSLNIIDTGAKGLVISGHPIIDAMIETKARENKPFGVEVKHYIRISEDLLVDEIDTGIILGNILDNAIEATHRLPQEKRTPIDVRILCNNGLFSITVINAVDHEVDTESLHTIKKDKLMHGHGVAQIKSTCLKYDGTAKFACKNNAFTVSVTMVNRPRG